MTNSPVLTVDKLTKIFGKETAVNDVHFTLEKGKCIALIGPNGAGKTTILRMLAGLLKPTSGEIAYVNGNDHDFRKLVGYLPQYPAMYGWMTGMEFLLHCAALSYIPKKSAKRRAEELLHKVGIADAANKKVNSFSGGMKQRLGIAQALIHQPKLVMLDEPVSALDPIGRREILTLMEELKEETTILFSTHILADADEVSDELLLIHDGKLVESGTMKELRRKYQTSTIALSFDAELDHYEQSLNKMAGVISTNIQRDIIHLSVEDVELVRTAIFTRANEETWPLTHFSIDEASLEDMFMKAVNQ